MKVSSPKAPTAPVMATKAITKLKSPNEEGPKYLVIAKFTIRLSIFPNINQPVFFKYLLNASSSKPLMLRNLIGTKMSKKSQIVIG